MTNKERLSGLDNFETVILKCMQGKIDFTKYQFVLDEDGYLVFLKRTCTNTPKKDWPINRYDGEVMFEMYTGEGRGLVITEKFLRVLQIKFLG